MTRVDKIFETLKNNRLVAIAIVIGTIVISLGAFFDAFKKLNPFKSTELTESAGIVDNAKTPGDFYHNARIYELGGDIKNAKENYNRYFESNQEYVDPHFFYQELLKNAEGIEGARQVYQAYADKYPGSMLYRYLLLRLADRKERIEGCTKLYGEDSSYMPVIYQLIVDYYIVNTENNTLNDQRNCFNYMTRFTQLNRDNYFFKYYIDKKEALKAIDYVDEKYKLAKKFDAAALATVADVDIEPYEEYAVLTVSPYETFREIWYRIDTDTSFKSMGLTDTKNEDGFFNSIYSTKINSLDSGDHLITVKYKNQNNEIVGPIQRKMHVKTFYWYRFGVYCANQWNDPLKELDLIYYKKDAMVRLYLSFMDKPYIKEVRIQSNFFKEKPVFKNGKNLTDDSDEPNSFDFKIGPGKYHFDFTITLVDNTVYTYHYDIKVTDDEGRHSFSRLQ
jgi:tetratricopeptide (TPR) repeat protein